ncbi:c-type cytochrome biogenesis protein CcsB [Thermodesulfitimonas autotrophica]|uniref:c-type cytochrome biogenesis protein CcsB n=1 Tax=Thermodesulfitimonas autotrophica TaxID=1894989 RepID=UPI002FE1095B
MYTIESNFFTLAFIAYVLSLAAFFSFFWTRSERSAKLGYLLTAAGLLLQLVSLTARSIAAGRWPFANLYEFISLMTFGIAAGTLIVGLRYRITATGIFATPLLAGLMAYAFSIKKAPEALVPALQSYWLQFHVATAILAYGAFALSCALGAMYLVKDRPGAPETGLRALIPETGRLERLIYGTIAFGFAFQTLLIITGAVWAEEAWGAWWSWDPMETWALITWIVYAFYLHGWTRGSWRGRRGAWLALIGFIAVLFTLIGVKYLMSGLHSYK